MRTILFSLLVCVGIASAQMLHYADSLESIAAKGYNTANITRSAGQDTAFKSFWWGPYDISQCWGDPNVPGVSTQADTMIFRGYMSGLIRYQAGDTVGGTWKAYLSCFPYPPQTLDGGSTTWDFNWNNADSLVSYKVRAASDFVSSSRDGYPMYSQFSIATVASDTIAYPYLYMVLQLDSVSGSSAPPQSIELDGYWTYDCIKRAK